MTSREGRAGEMGMLTINCPSPDEHLRWDVRGPRADRQPCGCHLDIGPEGIAGWNATCSRRWNHLRTLLGREYPGMTYIKATEVQKRGALHVHVILWVPGRLDVVRVQTLARAAGFGCVLDWAPCVPGSRRAAYYVAKYVTKDAEQHDVPWSEETVNRRTGEVYTRTRAHFRPWTAGRSWGMTMKQLRAIALASKEAAARARREADGLVLDVAAAPGAPGDATSQGESPPA